MPILRRLGEAAGSLLLLSLLAFALAHAMPGSTAQAILGARAKAPGLAAMTAQLGQDAPLWRQYLLWLAHLLTGNLGTSVVLNRPVSDLVAFYGLHSLALIGVGFTAGLTLAAATGLIIGAQAGHWPASALETAMAALYATPGLLLGSLLLLVFSARLHWLPGGGVSDPRHLSPTFPELAAHLLLPAATLALLVMPAPALLFAQEVAAQRAAPHCRAAMARGLPPALVLLRHAVPLALRPLVGWAGATLPAAIAGGVIVESIFDYPGLGWLLWRSAVGHDDPVLIALIMLLGLAAIAGNALAAAVNAWLDPRHG